MKRLRAVRIYFVGMMWSKPQLAISGWRKLVWTYSRERYTTEYDYIHIRILGCAFDILMPVV